MFNIILFFALSFYVYFVSKSYFIGQVSSQKVFFVVFFIVHFAAMGYAYNSNIIDSVVYYNLAKNANSWVSIFGVGSTFLSFLIYPLVQAGVSMFVLYCLFATISYQTFLWYFDQMSGHFSREVSFYGIPITQMFFLLPSLHYWSGFLGKDVLTFLFLTYLLFEIKKKSKFNFWHSLVLVLLLLLRPHVFMVFFVSVFLWFFTQKNISMKIKAKSLLLAALVISVTMPILMFFANIKDLYYNTIQEKWRGLNIYATHSGSGVDLMESSYLGRIGLLLFRPLYYDAVTFYQYVISTENSFVLIFFIWAIIYLYSKRKTIVIAGDVKMALLTGCLIVLMIAIYIYNLGLASRMRLMFMPLFFYALHRLVHSCSVEKA